METKTLTLTLWDRLRPRHKETIIDQKNEYPTLHDEAIKSLKARQNWLDLTLLELSTICTLLNKDISDTTIALLFENDDWSNENKLNIT